MFAYKGQVKHKYKGYQEPRSEGEETALPEHFHTLFTSAGIH